MKGIIKCVIAGAVIIGIGLAIVLGALAFNGWSVKKPTFTTQSYTAENDNTSINISIDAGSFKTEFYDGDKIAIEYPVSSVYKTEISENDGVFRYESDLKKTWFMGNLNIPDTVIKLPENVCFNLDIEVNAGTVNIASGGYGKVVIEVNAGTLKADGIKCEKFSGDVNAGTMKVTKLDCADIKADVSAGSVNIDIDGAKADYNIKADVSAGSCNVSNQTVENGKSLVVDCSAGSIKVSFAS